MKVRYVCSECGAEDYDNGGGSGPRPHALNCWKCHAGHGLDLQTMMARHVGMFPAGEVEGPPQTPPRPQAVH